MSKRGHGSSLDDLLDDLGIREEVDVVATRRVIAWQLQQAITEQKLTKTEMARRMGTSRAQLDRLLDPTSGNVTLESLERGAEAVGRRLHIELV